jgi:hypothetical protein
VIEGASAGRAVVVVEVEEVDEVDDDGVAAEAAVAGASAAHNTTRRTGTPNWRRPVRNRATVEPAYSGPIALYYRGLSRA